MYGFSRNRNDGFWVGSIPPVRHLGPRGPPRKTLIPEAHGLRNQSPQKGGYGLLGEATKNDRDGRDTLRMELGFEIGVALLWPLLEVQPLHRNHAPCVCSRHVDSSLFQGSS